MTGLLVLLYAVSSFSTLVFSRYAVKRGLVDIPNHRSAHQEATARGAGVVFVSLWAAWFLGAYYNHHISHTTFFTVLPAIFVSLLGFWDDFRGLSALRRLQAQFLAAGITVAVLSWVAPMSLFGLSPLLSVPLMLLILVWSTNLFNFMDGTDGIAAVEALSVLGFGGWMLHKSGVDDAARICGILCMVLLGFLRWNWPKARVFMGDVGSGFLGFVIAGVALLGVQEANLSLFYWLILYGVFVFDATLTLARRLLAGHRITQAHKLHAYQRLHQSGYSHKAVLYVTIACNLTLGVLALLAFYHIIPLNVSVALATVLLLLGFGWIEKRKPFA